MTLLVACHRTAALNHPGCHPNFELNTCSVVATSIVGCFPVAFWFLLKWIGRSCHFNHLTVVHSGLFRPVQACSPPILPRLCPRNLVQKFRLSTQRYIHQSSAEREPAYRPFTAT